MREADEIAENILRAFNGKPASRDGAKLLVTRFMGTPSEAGHVIHAEVTAAICTACGL